MASETHAPAEKKFQSVTLASGLNYLLCLVWFGLLAGLAEALVTLACGWFKGHYLFISEHVLWMTPVAEAVFYLIMGLPLLLLAWVFPRRKLLFVMVGVIAFFAVLSTLWVSGKLIWWASCILATGVALRCAWTVRSHPDGFLRLVRWSTPGLIAIVALCAVATCGHNTYREHQALAQCPQAAAEAPNVLLVVLDTVRADALSNYSGCAVDTPNIKQFGEQGILFERALSTCSWTLPSHASMFTGRYPHELSADWNSVLDDRYPTLAETLGREGYATAGFVANLTYCSRSTGLARGFAHYEDFALSVKEVARNSFGVRVLTTGDKGFARVGLYDSLGRKDAKTITGDFLSWLDRRPHRPFFAFLNYLDAHDPYLPEQLIAENRRLTHEEKLAMRHWRKEDPRNISDKHRELARNCYNSKIRELDEQMGQLLGQLDKRGLRENTIVIITSDHGEHFGEHGVYYHGNTLYESAVHVPLMISWPNRLPANTRVTSPVSLRDLAATILDLTDVSDPRALPGTSLQVTWHDSPALPSPQTSRLFCSVSPHPAPDKMPMQKYSPAAKGIMYSLLDGQDYVIREGDNAVRLFDFQNMGSARTNLADDDACRTRVQRTVQELDRFLDSHPALEGCGPDPPTQVGTTPPGGRTVAQKEVSEAPDQNSRDASQ